MAVVDLRESKVLVEANVGKQLDAALQDLGGQVSRQRSA